MGGLFYASTFLDKAEGRTLLMKACRSQSFKIHPMTMTATAVTNKKEINVTSNVKRTLREVYYLKNLKYLREDLNPTVVIFIKEFLAQHPLQGVDDLFAAAIPPPIAPPPAASQPAALPRKPSLTNEVSNVDLLGGFDAPTIPTIEANRPSRPAPVDPVIDLFAQISSTPVASAPAAAPAQNNIDLFGFGAAPIAATTTPTSNFDALGSLSFTPVANYQIPLQRRRR
ncbi:unnamed protein product [Caenorhabditis bovis]|uniref:Uncharacterized protein n=1 Tax=Caenorhabditis bovis TaxID=2654633 RepID=A0A8S1F9Q1_9PELO|nr:unnamed protein product [Caenorhabditis bovis]